MNVCIIPARGGSKRIPRKNIKEFCGKPVIAWSIEAAVASECFDYIVVSTDDLEISDVAKNYGADVPFLRPSDLADDLTPTRPVICHAITELEKTRPEFDNICVIYPAAPLIQKTDICLGLEALQSSSSEFALSVTTYPYPIQRSLRVLSGGGIEMRESKYRLTRSQDLEVFYHDAGQFYWGKRAAFLSDADSFSQRSIPIILPSWRVVDVDTEDDWKRAELLFRSLNLGMNPITSSSLSGS